MTCGIYKIENLINGKIYIGQSKHIEKRFQQHCRKSSRSDLSLDILEFGKSNFSFEILEKCNENELLEKESYYISKFNSMNPNGYNKSIMYDEKSNFFHYYTLDTLYNIVSDIKNTTLSFSEIAERYDINIRMVYYINSGEHHRINDICYPIRALNSDVPKTNICKNCGCAISGVAKLCRDCYSIKSRTVERPTKDVLYSMILEKTFIEIGNMYGVSDNTIRKWCKYYGLPYKYRDIKELKNSL